MKQPAADFEGSRFEITLNKLRLPSSETSVVLFSLGDQPRCQTVITHHLNAKSSCHLNRSGLLTGYGLDFLAKKLAGPKVDRATLQLVGV
eukprot:6469327-Amphidinium_carterae.1